MTRGVKLDRYDWGRVQARSGAPNASTPGNIYIDQSTGRLYVRRASGYGWDMTGGSLDASYNLGGSITVDSSAVTLTVPNNSNNAGLEVNQNDVTNNPHAVTITNAGTGSAINISGAGTRKILSDARTLTIATTTSGDIVLNSVADFDFDAQNISIQANSAIGFCTIWGLNSLELYANNNLYTSSKKVWVSPYSDTTGTFFECSDGGGTAGMNSAAGTDVWANFEGRFEQSGTAAYVVLNVDTNIITTGSGTKKLLNVAYEGSPKVWITSDGILHTTATITGDAADLTLEGRSASITLNQSGDTTLAGGFTATSIIGALNELYGATTPPGGSSGQIQWNSSSAFAGTDNAYWDDTNDALVIGGQTASPWTSTEHGLVLAKNASSYGIRIATADNTDGYYPKVDLVRAAGTLASPTVVLINDVVGVVNWYGVHTAGSMENVGLSAQIRVSSAGTWSGSSYGADFSIYTTNINETTAKKRLTIDHHGDVYFYDNDGNHLFELSEQRLTAKAPYRAGEPVVESGAFFYDTSANLWKFGENGGWVTLASGGGGVTLDGAYNTSGGAASISVDAGDVSWVLNGVYSFDINLQSLTGSSDGFMVEDLGDTGYYFNILKDTYVSGVSINSYLYEVSFTLDSDFGVNCYDASVIGSNTAQIASDGSGTVYVGVSGDIVDIGDGVFNVSNTGMPTIVSTGVSEATSTGRFTASIDREIVLTYHNGAFGGGNRDLTVVNGGLSQTMMTCGYAGNISITPYTDQNLALTGAGSGSINFSVETGNVVFGSSDTGHVRVEDNVKHAFGASSDAYLKYDLTQTVDTLVLAVSADSNHIVIAQAADIDASYDFGHAQTTNPTVWIQSANQSATEYMGLSHNQTDMYTIVGEGSQVINHITPVSLADDGSFDLPDASAGYGSFSVGDGEAFAKIQWTSAGVVTILYSNGNVSSGDDNGFFCFFDNGTSVRVRNRLGSAKTVMFDYHYTTSP